MDPKPRGDLQVVALRYAPGEDAAPKVAAKGKGYLADRILELAREHNIPIREDRNLVQVLSLLDLDEEIPASVYKAVAEILAFVYRLTNRPPPQPVAARPADRK
jgi:flagellar biosynthesis protein